MGRGPADLWKFKGLTRRVVAATVQPLVSRAPSNNRPPRSRESVFASIPAAITAGLVVALALMAVSPSRGEGPIQNLRILAPVPGDSAARQASATEGTHCGSRRHRSRSIDSLDRIEPRDAASWRHLDLPPPIER